jgi:hypothetical protein
MRATGLGNKKNKNFFLFVRGKKAHLQKIEINENLDIFEIVSAEFDIGNHH